MIDLNWTEQTFGLALLFNIAFFLFVITYYKRYIVYPSWNKTTIDCGLACFSLCLIIFVSSSSSSDWYHYQTMVWDYDFTPGAHNHGEPVYGYIIKLVNKNYFLFRLVVWGGAFFLACLSFKRFGINVNVAVFFLVAVFLIKFNYARVSLAMASYFYGLSFLFKPIKRKRFLSLVLVTPFLWGAYEFHHSLLPVILLTLIAYLPLDKPVVAILLFLVIPFMASYVFANFNILGSYADEDLYSKFNRYMEKESEEANFLGHIANVIQYGAFVIPLIIDSIVIFKSKENVSMPMRRMLRVSISITLFAMMFMFMNFFNTVFTYRYLFMTFIPLTILSIYLYQNRLLKKNLFFLIVLWGIGSNLYGLLYGLYKVL